MAWHPWRTLCDLAHIEIKWVPVRELPPSTLGDYNHETHEIRLALGQSQAQRRCTLTHELIHHDRGPVPAHQQAREERVVDAEAARRLIPFDDLARAMVWTDDEHELADLLWVDHDTILVRLRGLTDAESAHLVQLLEDAELRIP